MQYLSSNFTKKQIQDYPIHCNTITKRNVKLNKIQIDDYENLFSDIIPNSQINSEQVKVLNFYSNLNDFIEFFYSKNSFHHDYNIADYYICSCVSKAEDLFINPLSKPYYPKGKTKNS